MNYNGYIMSGDDAVARVIDNSIEPIIREKMPLYLSNGGSFSEWLISRAIDRHRPNSRILKKMLRLSDTSDISTVLYVHAATITDNYWVKSEKDILTYGEVSFKENYFADIALIGSARSYNQELTHKELSSKTPELTSIGSYEKCWKQEDGTWYMYKQGNELERFSEIFIFNLSKRLGFPSAEYMPDNKYVKTRDFTSPQYNYEPIAALVGDNEDYILNYDKLFEISRDLTKQYLDILFMDTLCFNMDRHTYNYGLLRDKKTGEIISMAPNFDNNIALISRGYGDGAKNSSNLLIELFGELLKKRGIRYGLPVICKEEVFKIAEWSLPDEKIDRNYVAEFVMDRYERMEQLIQSLSLSQGKKNMPEAVFAAHIRDDGQVQSVKAHLEGTADLAKGFAEDFGGGAHAYLCGMLHDVGKYSAKFQKRICHGGNRVDHSTAGGVEINKRLEAIGFLLAYCIMGHHAGLPDGGSRADTSDEATLNGRLRRKIESYIEFEKEIELGSILPKPMLPIRPLGRMGFSASFYVRMLFSCLVDGDFLDTEYFMSGTSNRSIGESLNILNSKFDEHIKAFKNPVEEINKKRCEILKCCIDKAIYGKGLYTLTVPTGGGKTVSSLGFALKHAKENGMKRIIYVIPYNSIIEQNAAVFKKILGAENVLEHHSNFSYDEDETTDIAEKQRLASENWDMPVIVTTTVQFFESIFANKPSKCRKLHNIANSVIIFDEAQMLPTQYLLPCIRAISELVHNYGSTAVLCSATQPALGNMFPKELAAMELCENTGELFKFFRRTRIISEGELQDDELAERLNTEKQVLCIVNTRKQAQNVFKLLKEEGSYHLSTLMYPEHRKMVLSEVRQRLEKGLTCRVVSTSLIEAGVDVDFPAVYRAEAGLDSVIQAAGRCNREGKRGESPVRVFKPSEEYRRHMPSMLRRPTEITRSIEAQFSDISSPEAISSYFLQLYKTEGEGLDSKKIVESFEDGFKKALSFPFAEVAACFRLIENSTRSVVIPCSAEARELVQRLKNGEHSRELLRSIQRYTVNVYARNYDALYGAGSIQPLDDELSVLADMERYSLKTGLDAGTDSGMAIFN